jgi:hypothetical protein
MKKIYKICSTIFLLLILLSCNSSKTNRSCSEYKVLRVETKELDDFVEIILIDDNEHKYFVLSSKANELNKNNISFDTLKKGQDICINLIPQDTTYRVSPIAFKYSTGPYEIYYDKMLLIKNGIVVTRVYRSNDLIDKFIRKK